MRRISGPCLGTLILLAMAASSALAQERTERFATEPQLVFNAGGHHAPIHRLLFSADESQLFSSGDDRVIHVWDLGPEPKWARSLRPFVWTGRRGVIEFMATTSVEPGGAPGPGLVAGGNGVTSRVGDLSYFRLKPDPNAPANPLAAIWNDHMAGVVAMAADQAGTRVATASLDGTVRVRDVGTGSTRILTVEQNASALLRPIDQKPEAPAWRPARGLTFDPSGRWLVASGVRGAANGLLFVWDLQAEPDSDRKPRIVRGDGGLAGTSPMTSISTIAISPNGTSLLVGLSDPILHKGALWGLFRLEFPAMTNPFAFPFTRPGDHPPKSRFLGSVRAITTLDDRSFATAIDDRAVVKDNQAEPPDFHTWVEIRQTSDGRVIERVGNDGLRPWPGPISTLAYSPKQGWLAFADADRREIVIKDVRKGWQNPNFPLVRLAGPDDVKGRAIRDVGFRGPGGELIAFRRGTPDTPFRGADLTRRPLAFDDVPEADLARALSSWNGWQVQALDSRRLQVTSPQGEPVAIALPPGILGRWFGFSLIPTGEGHPAPCLAVACRFGIAIYRLDGKSATFTRFLRGHASNVTAVAPSRDGKWLLSGSDDQTLRLWLLAGCDQVKPFGATIQQDGPNWVVNAVTPRSPADFLGLLKGDVIRAIYAVDEASPALSRRLDLNAESIARLDRDEPGPLIQIAFRRPGEAQDRTLSTSKYDDPALAFFLDEQENDWIAWMPSGYYVPSVLGDRKFLGFQINNTSPLAFDPKKPPDFVPMSQFEKQLHRPRVIDNLLRTGDITGSLALAQADGNPEPRLEADLPLLGQIELGEGLPVQPRAAGIEGLEVAATSLAVTLAVTSPDTRRTLARVEVFDNGMLETEVPVQPPAAPFRLPLNLAIGEGDRRKTIVLVSDTGSRREIDWPYRGRSPRKAAPRLPRLELLAFGPRFAPGHGFGPAGNAPEIEKATQALARTIVEPIKRAHYEVPIEDLLIPSKAGDSASDFKAALLRLQAEAQAGHLGAARFDETYAIENPPVDTIVLLMDTHILHDDQDDSPTQSRSLILGSDYEVGGTTGAIAGADLAKILGELSRRGCRVVVFLDGFHTIPPTRKHGVPSLARDLINVGVDVYVGSENRLSQPNVFAQAVDTVLREGKGLGGSRDNLYSPNTLLQALRKEVEAQTNRNQKVQHRPGQGKIWITAPLARPR